MSRRSRLKEIIEVRKTRDELINCDNYGRKVALLYGLGDVRTVTTQRGYYCYIEIKMYGGWEYRFEGYNPNKVALKLYSIWRDKYLNENK